MRPPAVALAGLLCAGCVGRGGFLPVDTDRITCDTTTGLVGHWPLDQGAGTTVPDRSGNGHDGQTCSGQTCPAPGPSWNPTGGMLGGSMSFDGIDDCVVMPHSPELELAPGESLTLATWYRAPAADANLIFSDNQWSYNYALYLGSIGEISFQYTSETDGQHHYTSLDSPFTPDAWQHVAAIYTAGDGSSAQLYINGALVAGYWTIGSGDSEPLPDGRPLSLGCTNNQGEPEYHSNVELDDVRIYERRLRAEEVALLARRPRAPDASTGLIGHWPLDETSGTVAADTSGNDNHGSLMGFPSQPWRPSSGPVGGALEFAGPDAGARLSPPHAVLDNLSAVTVSAWVNMSAYNDFGDSLIFDIGTPTSGWYFGLTFNDRPAFGAPFQDASVVLRAGPETADLGEWVHLAASWDGGADPDGIRIYVNGSETGYMDWTSSATGARGDDSMTTAYLGSCCGDSTAFDGLMDDVRVYDRVLAPEDILALYENVMPPTCR